MPDVTNILIIAEILRNFIITALILEGYMNKIIDIYYFAVINDPIKL